MDHLTRRWIVRGQVQGVGFRPFVYNLASRYQLGGYVQNRSCGVVIEVTGPATAVQAFLGELATCPSPAQVSEIVEQPLGEDSPQAFLQAAVQGGFSIISSQEDGPAATRIPPDRSVCAECLAELNDPTNRRWAHPFINCTRCGPRYTVIQGLPYDRSRTSMSGFPLCQFCQQEYTHPQDRRFHAEPICCPYCGPRLSVHNQLGEATSQDPLKQVADLLLAGEIVAIKGLGGFHLAARADDQQAVARLREIKRRPAKPLAVMVPTLEVALSLVDLSPEARELLKLACAKQPIVLAPKRRHGDWPHHEDSQRPAIAENVAPGTHRLGVFLPYNPIQHLLFAKQPALGPLVMTSANVSGEPLIIDDLEVCQQFGVSVAAILGHNRPILRPVDDSVVLDCGAEGILPLRRGWGYVPESVPLSDELASVGQGVCVGGELKVAPGVVRQGEVFLGPHLGDLKHPATLELFAQTLANLPTLLGVSPQWIACDTHPLYHSRRVAVRMASELNVPLVEVQHHHAHAASLLAEHRHAGPMLAVVCDGVGYGSDGTIWGGELLQCDLRDFRRIARLRPLPLPGGDAAAEDIRRSGLSQLYQTLLWRSQLSLWADSAGQDWFEHPAALKLIADRRQRDWLARIIQQGVNCVPSSAAGRLFDAVAALLGLAERNQFEAQAALALEAAAFEATDTPDAEAFAISTDAASGLVELDPRPFVQWLLQQQAHRETMPKEHLASIAASFHEQLASAWASVVVTTAQQSKINTIGLTGGVFANVNFARRLSNKLQNNGLMVLRHRLVPPGDGGLALGQAAVAAARLSQ